MKCSPSSTTRRLGVLVGAALTVVALAGCRSPKPAPAAVSIAGAPLAPLAPEEGPAATWLQAEIDAALAGWQFDPTEIRAVWVGRRLAYAGLYRDAIQWYAGALETFPSSYRLRRHLGHRLLTIREVDAAIAVLTEARALAATAPNRLEPDGAPGPESEPRSTTHGNIDYHLALGHYLRGDFDEAATLWSGCVTDWARNDDARVAALHWAYMSLVRANRRTAADALLQRVGPTPDVIENVAYAELVQLYRGERTAAELLARPERSAALEYGLARWQLANGDEAGGEAMLRALAARPGWTSFGVLAAEADIARLDGTAVLRGPSPEVDRGIDSSASDAAEDQR